MNEEDGKTKGLHSDRVLTLRFLFEAYRPGAWYWEIVETFRRLMMTAVLSVIDQGTSAQGILAMLLSTFFIKMYGDALPYYEDKDNALSECGQYQIYFSFFAAVVIQNSLLGDEYDMAVGVLLIAVNLGVFILAFVYEYNEYCEIIEEEEKADESLNEKAEEQILHNIEHKLGISNSALGDEGQRGQYSGEHTKHGTIMERAMFAQQALRNHKGNMVQGQDGQDAVANIDALLISLATNKAYNAKEVTQKFTHDASPDSDEDDSDGDY
jgi:hypothetical protein